MFKKYYFNGRLVYVFKSLLVDCVCYTSVFLKSGTESTVTRSAKATQSGI